MFLLYLKLLIQLKYCIIPKERIIKTLGGESLLSFSLISYLYNSNTLKEGGGRELVDVIAVVKALLEILKYDCLL